MIQLGSALVTQFHRDLATPAWLASLAAHVEQALVAHPEYQTVEGTGRVASRFNDERFMGPRSAVKCDFTVEVRVARWDAAQDPDVYEAWVRYLPRAGTFSTLREVIITRETQQRDRDAPPVEVFGPDHLVPDNSPIVQPPEFVAHMGRLGELLLDKPRMTGLGLVFVVCLPRGRCAPPFPGEWAVVCERVGEIVTLAESADPVIWATLGRAAPRIERRTRRLDRGGYETVEAAWRTVLRGVRVAAPHEPIEGVHWIGDTYVFGSLRQGGQAITGETAAPPAGSAPDRLVDLSHTLREYVLADESVLPDVAARVRTEAAWFRRMPQPGHPPGNACPPQSQTAPAPVAALGR